MNTNEIGVNTPLVTIQCLVYNHEPYLRQCLDGFVMQKTNFKFEAIVHDDCSTDSSVTIIKEYAEKYPDIIKPIYEIENQYSKAGFQGILKILYEMSVGKYIAFCEGDDYWIDPLKLQKQVDFLESNPECAYSCCRYMVYDEFTHKEYLYPNKYFDRNKEDTFFKFNVVYPFLHDWVTKTLTCIYRKDALDISQTRRFHLYRDVHMVYFILQSGMGVCHSFVGGVFRKNPTSTYNSQSNIVRSKINYEVYKEFYYITRSALIKKVYQRMFVDYWMKNKNLPSKNKVEKMAIFYYYPRILVKSVLSICRIVHVRNDD